MSTTATPSSTDAPIIIDRLDGLAVIRLNRPERMNAITTEMIEALICELGLLAGANDVRVVVLTGNGRAFCAGGDLANLTKVDDRPLEQAIDESRHLMSVAESIHDFPKPVIAAVNGACAGAGMSLACAADLRVASRTAVFAAAFLRAGRAGDYGLAWTLPRLVGAGRARRLLLLGERLSADNAMEVGLVDQVVDDDVVGAAVRTACEIADLSPLAVRNLKRNLLEAESGDLGTYLDGEAARHIRTSRGPEAIEAASALVEKRRPSFAISTPEPPHPD